MSDTYSFGDLDQMAALTPERPSQTPLPPSPSSFEQRWPGADAPFQQGGIGALLQQPGATFEQRFPQEPPATFKERFPSPMEEMAQRAVPQATRGITPPAPQPPATPPQPKPHEPYIGTRGDPNAAAWGRDDFIMQGASRYPGMSVGPHMPQPADYPGIIQRSGGALGRLGAGFVQFPALLMMGHADAFWKAYNQGLLQKAQLHQIQFKNALAESVNRQNTLSREYGQAFAAYGPRTENGKFNPGDESALDEAIRAIAAKYHDNNMLAVLNRGGSAAAARVIQHLDASGKDLGKMQMQILRGYQIDKAKFEKEKREREAGEAAKRKQDWFDTGTPGAPAAPETAAPETPETPETSDTTETSETPDTSEAPDTTDTTETPDTTDKTDTSTAEPEAKTQPDRQAEAPEAPQAAEAPEAAAAPEAPRPTRLAQADTGTATDAPRPGEGQAPTSPEEIARLRETGLKALRGEPTTAPAPSAPRAATGAPRTSPRIDAAAQQLQAGQKPALPKDQEILDAVNKQKARLDAYMHSLINDQTLTPDQVQARAASANPSMGALVKGLLDGTTELTRQDSDKPHNVLAAALARAINPDYERTSKQKRDQRDLEARRAQVRPLQRALGQQYALHSNLNDVLGKNVADMKFLLALADRLKAKGLETEIPVVDRLIREGRRLVGGDVDVQKFDAQLRLVRTDVGRILSTGASGTGAVYPVSAQKEMHEFLNSGLNVEQLRGVVDVIKRDYMNKLAPITDEINSLRGLIAQIEGVAPPEPIHDENTRRIMDADEVQMIDGKMYYLRNGKWHDD